MAKTRVAWPGITQCGDLLGDCAPWLKAHGALEETEQAEETGRGNGSMPKLANTWLNDTQAAATAASASASAWAGVNLQSLAKFCW